MKKQIILIVVFLFSSLSFSKSISGIIGFKTKEGDVINDLTIIMGNPKYGKQYGFPDYLSGLASRYTDEGDAVRSYDGKFKFDGVISNQRKILIIKHLNSSYLKKMSPLKNEPYIWNELIELPSKHLRNFKGLS